MPWSYDTPASRYRLVVILGIRCICLCKKLTTRLSAMSTPVGKNFLLILLRF
jgi:hypothetical protein